MLDNGTLAQIEKTFPEDHPDIVYLVLDAYFGTGADTSGEVDTTKQHVTASIGLVSTFSRGNVSIASSNAGQNPLVDPNWLLDPRDQKMAVAAFKRARQLFATHSMKPVVDSEVYPGTNVTTDEQILETIRESANSIYNAVGTNKMGTADDPMAVVDSQGRVFGVQNLRVVDASILPFLPTSQPSGTIYAVAEKIADDILEPMHSIGR